METRAAAWIRPWDGTEQPDVVLVGAPLSRTSISHSGASQTPEALREMFGTVTTYNIDHDIDLAMHLSVRDAGDARMHVTDLARCRAAIRDSVSSIRSGAPASLSIVMGGDHSITAPAVEAVRESVGHPVGLIQLDAHMDLRNLADAGPTNGTPVRQLVEGGTVAGRNVVQIGLHAFANAASYRAFAVASGITQITAREVAHSPIAGIVARALDAAGDGTGSIYVTVDMDVLDQAFAPGAPALVPAGMTSWQLMDALLLLGEDPRVGAIDFVEVDATRDPRTATVRATVHGMLTFLTGVALRSARSTGVRGGEDGEDGGRD